MSHNSSARISNNIFFRSLVVVCLFWMSLSLMPYSSVSPSPPSLLRSLLRFFSYTHFSSVFSFASIRRRRRFSRQRTDFWPECRSMLLCLNIIKYHLTPLLMSHGWEEERGREGKKRREKKFTWDSKWSELFFCFCSIFIHDIIYDVLSCTLCDDNVSRWSFLSFAPPHSSSSDFSSFSSSSFFLSHNIKC